MTTYFYNFTGTNGSSLPAGWTSYLSGASGEVADIQSNAARLLTGTLANFSSCVGMTHSQDIADPSVTWSWKFDNPIRESVARMQFRASNDWNVGAEVSSTCYAIAYHPESGAITLKYYSGGSIGTLASATFTPTASLGVDCRLFVSGGLIEFRMWDSGTTEPSTWQIVLTDHTIGTSGRCKFAITNGTLAQAVVLTHDTVSIDDQAPSGTGVAATARMRLGVFMRAVAVSAPSTPITPTLVDPVRAVAHSSIRPLYSVTSTVEGDTVTATGDNTYAVETLGESVTITYQASDLNDDSRLLDPDTLSLRLLGPIDGQRPTVTYADAQVVQLAAGSYGYDVLLDEAGQWAYRWDGGGGDITGNAPFTGYINVPDDPFYPDGRYS